MKTSARRGSLEGLLLCRHLCDEMVVDEEPSKPAQLVRSGCRGKNRKNTVATLKRLTGQRKSGYLTAGENFRWVVVQSGTSEKKTNQK